MALWGIYFFKDGLKFNAMMHVLDVRLNVDIDRDTLQKIMEQVMINSSGHSTDYEWMDLGLRLNRDHDFAIGLCAASVLLHKFQDCDRTYLLISLKRTYSEHQKSVFPPSDRAGVQIRTCWNWR